MSSACLHPDALAPFSSSASTTVCRSFLIGEDDFDEIFGRVRERGLAHWADPGRQESGAINRNDGGRGVYFEDPDGHLLEVITRPYGSGE